MPFQITCACGKRLTVPDAKAGGKGRCPACSRTVALAPGPAISPLDAEEPQDFFVAPRPPEPDAPGGGQGGRIPCPHCSEQILVDAKKCRHCWEWLETQTASRLVRRRVPQVPASGTNRQMLGFLGSVILFVGVFMPIVRAPIVGDMNYFQNGKGDGVIIMSFAAVSFFLVIARKYGGLWLTAVGSASVLAFTLFNFQSKMEETKAALKADLADNPFPGLADIAVQGVQLQWGLAILVVGIVMLLAVAMMRDTPARRPRR